MIFTELVLENFGPYGHRQVINLCPEIAEESRPIILFGGLNGGGKTTLMDAIRLVLYGQRAECSTRKNLSYGEFLTQCVNSKTPANELTKVELTVQLIRSDRKEPVDLKIIRQWTRNPKDGKDMLGILDGEWPDIALANTWDEYIETILPIGISNLFLFDGEQVKELAEADTPIPSVVEAIKSLLGLELGSRLAVDLDVLVSRKRKALASGTQLADLDEIEVNMNLLKEEKAAVTAELETAKINLHKADKRYRRAYNKYRLEGGKIASQRSQLEGKIQNLEEEKIAQREAMVRLAGGVLPLSLILPLLEDAIIQGNKELKGKEAEIATEVLVARDSRLLTYLQELSLTGEQVKGIKSFLQQENKTLEKDKVGVTPFLAIEEEDLKQLVNVTEYQLPREVEVGKERRTQLENLEEEIDGLQRQLAIAAGPETYKQLDDAVKEAQQHLIECKAELEIVQRKDNEVEKKITAVKKELEQYSEEMLTRENNQHIIKSVDKVKKTLELFREQMTLKKLNKLEGEISECFRYLLHKSDLINRVTIASDSFRLSLYDDQGNLVPQHRLSAGEKQLLAIAFLWGLARVSGRNLPVAIDTPLGRLDSSHRHNLVERYFPAASHQVILLSTDTEIGKKEVGQLEELGAIAREYLLEYDSTERKTTVSEGYFF